MKIEHDTIDISVSQIKLVAPFPPVINDLNFGLVGPGPQPGWTVCPICPSKRGDNEFKSTRPQFAIGNSITHMLHKNNNNMGGVLFNLKLV